jgi:hypothetical protein
MANIVQEASTVICGGESNTRHFLTTYQVAMIDEALAALGDYGEVRLVVEKGRLRYLVTQKSFDALKWQPGSFVDVGG